MATWLVESNSINAVLNPWPAGQPDRWALGLLQRQRHGLDLANGALFFIFWTRTFGRLIEGPSLEPRQGLSVLEDDVDLAALVDSHDSGAV